MKQKIKQLQSSGVTRKTNRPWHFLSTLNSLLLSKLLLLLIIPAMGTASAWGADYTVALSSFTESPTGTYTYSKKDFCKGSGMITWFEVPSASAAGTITVKGSVDDSSRKLYIKKTNGTVQDDTRYFESQTSYPDAMEFSASDILTNDGKYYLVFVSSGDFKGQAVKITLATTYTVTFDGRDRGTPASTSITQASIGASISLPSCTANTYYQFLGWSTSSTATAPDAGMASGSFSPYTPTENTTLYAVYKSQLFSQVSPAGAGYVTMKETNSEGTTINSGDYVSRGQALWMQATANPGYTFLKWTEGYVSTDNPLTYSMGENAKTMTASFKAKTYTITLDANGGSAAGSATATYNSNTLGIATAPTRATYTIAGYYKEPGCTNKIALADGTLCANTDYTDASGNWNNDDDVITLYPKWEAQVAVPYDLTTNPVIDFTNTTHWTTSDALSTANTNVVKNNVVFRASTSSTFKIIDNSGTQCLSISDGNARTSDRWFAIPVTGINRQIDVYIQAPYASGFTVKSVLATGTTTVVNTGTNAPSFSDMKSNIVEDYFGAGKDAYHFRINELSVSDGVLYIGRCGSSYPLIEKIKLVSEDVTFEVSPTAVSVSDAGTQEVTIENNTDFAVLIDDSSLDTDHATYSYDSGNKKITISGVSAGDAGSIDVFLDKNKNGSYDAGVDPQHTITITVTGLGISTQPVGARYTTKGTSASNLTVTATGSPTSYQWYKNDKMSTAGATAISSATKYKPSTDFDEDLSYYYCVISKDGYNSVTSNIVPVLTTVTKRTFWMNPVTRRSTTSETELALTNGEDVNIYGGTATFYQASAASTNYVYNYDNVFFQTNSAGRYFKLHLNSALTAGMTITLTTNGLEDGRGVWLSSESTRAAAESRKIAFTGTNGVNTQTYTVKAGDALVGEQDIYVYSSVSNSSGYFGPLYITEALPLTVSAPQPASQTVEVDETPASISVTASGGTGSYTYQWQKYVDSTWKNIGDGTGGTVVDGTGYTTATYTPASKATAGSFQYRCAVTSSTTVNSSSVTVEVKATVDYYKIGTGVGEDVDFTDGKYTISNMQTLYKNQYDEGTSTATSNFWYLVKKDGTTTITPGTTTGLASAFNSNGYLQLKAGSDSKPSAMIFYVKGARSFKVICSGENKKFNVTVDGVDQVTESSKTSEKDAIAYALNKSNGSIIRIAASGSDEPKITSIIFYEYLDTELTIQKDGENVTTDEIYGRSGAVTLTYDVVTNGDGEIGAVPTISNTSVVSAASYDDGVLTLTMPNPMVLGDATVTLRQKAGNDYGLAEATLTVTVKNHVVGISVSSDKVTLKASESGTANNVLPTAAASKLPTFSFTLDGEPWTPEAGDVHYVSDDNSVVYFSNSGDFTSTSYVLYRGTQQGGPKITAYVNDSPSSYIKGETCSYYLQIEAGKSNPLESDDRPAVQLTYEMDDNTGAEAIALTYGGYKYNDHKLGSKTDSWSVPKDDYSAIDGYDLYSWNGNNDAMNEDKSQITITETNSMWYQSGASKPVSGTYANNERLKPFNLPCAGSYLKYEAKKTGTLTAYVYQNGIIGMKGSDGKIASNPRVGYWFNQDGWRISPDIVVSKNVLKEKYEDYDCGRDRANYETGTAANSLDKWNEKDSYQALVKMLRSKYCKKENNPLDKNTLTQDKDDYSDTWDAVNFKYDNPYYWMTQAEIEENVNKKVPTKVRPVPFNGGYLMLNAGYVKYVLKVIAGNTYYFMGSGTKIGYVGMNFVAAEEEDGAYTSDGFTDYRHASTLELDQRGAFAAPANPTVYDEATLNRTFKVNTWNTITLPFAVSEQQVENVFGHGTKLSLYNGLKENEDGSNYFTVRFINHVDQNILPGQPYFIKPTGVDANGDNLASVADGLIGKASDNSITFKTVIVDPTKLNLTTTETYGDDADVQSDGTTLEGKTRYKFTPTLAVMDGGDAPHLAKAAQYSLYMDNGGVVRKASSGPVTIAAYRAYLKPNDGEVNYSQMSLSNELEIVDVPSDLSGDDTPTMIIMINDDKAEVVNSKMFDGKTYNIMGQQVDIKTAKGLMIVNGKKYYKQ